MLYIAVSSIPRNVIYYSVKNTPTESVLQTLATSVSIPIMFAPLKKGSLMLFDGSVYETTPGGPFISKHPSEVIQYQIEPIDTSKNSKSILEFMVTLMKNLISMRSEYNNYKNIYVKMDVSDIYNFSMDDDTKIKLYAHGYSTCNS